MSHGTNPVQRVEESKKQSPKHQRSLFGLRKTTATVPSHGGQSREPIRPKTSLFSLRKTPSRITNLDQVAKGFAPQGNITPTQRTVHTRELSSGRSTSATPRQYRPGVQTSKATPTRILTPIRLKQQGKPDDQEYSTSLDDSMVSKEVASHAPTDDSITSKDTDHSKELPKPVTKPPRTSLFNMRKTPTMAPKLLKVAEDKTPLQYNSRHLVSPRQHHSSMKLQPTSPSRIPTPIPGRQGRNFTTPILPSQKKEVCTLARTLGQRLTSDCRTSILEPIVSLARFRQPEHKLCPRSVYQRHEHSECSPACLLPLSSQIQTWLLQSLPLPMYL